ncbi:TRAPPC8 [Symbiodinium pilosum]|uniref:TRAPPC8 protein n=1 Tax=Symbiodinium pilosum TaxID=2952 RepID=A0A812SJG8_SYMPI|nr:TRAPPC8 [Symbiodinium pilosum]
MRVTWEIFGMTLRGRLLDKNGDALEDVQAVEFAPQDVELGPLESKKIRLVAVPRQEGMLQIQGVKWNIFDCNQVVCDRPFQLKGRRLRSTLEQRASRTGMYSADLRMEIKVRSWKPRLQARLDGWPSPPEQPSEEPPAALMQGELHRCSLIIKAGDADCPLRLLQVATSHPQFVAVENDSLGNQGASAELTAEGIRLQGDLQSLFDAATHELKLQVLLRLDAGAHTLRFLILAEAGVADVPKSDQRQWITLEEQVVVQPAVSVTARPSPSFSSDGRFIFTCLVENRLATPVQVVGISGFCDLAPAPLDLQAFTAGEQLVAPGDSVQLLYALCWPAESVHVATRPARWRLLQACRQAAACSSKSKSKPCRKSTTTDLAIQWRSEGRVGEAFCLQVPLERPEAPPCPLDLHLLAPDTAEVAQLVPVTVKIRNASLAGPVSFYFMAESTTDLAWVGCERSEIIRLPANEYHSEIIQAYFSQPGIYNLNRFRLYVVGMPSSTVPASEQAPMAFAVPFERLLHVQAVDSLDSMKKKTPEMR